LLHLSLRGIDLPFDAGGNLEEHYYRIRPLTLTPEFVLEPEDVGARLVARLTAMLFQGERLDHHGPPIFLSAYRPAGFPSSLDSGPLSRPAGFVFFSGLTCLLSPPGAGPPCGLMVLPRSSG
jgi:hypothetical protein